MSANQEWAPGRIEELCRLWDYVGPEGNLLGPQGRYFSTAEIGRILGVTKSAVVGKAHRLGLTRRDSPIRPNPAGPRPIAPRRLPSSIPTLPSLAAVPTQVPRLQPASTGVAQLVERRSLEPKVAGSSPAAGATPAPGKTCCFPFGMPGTKGFRFCGKPAKPGKPYCRDCCDVAYIKIRDRREDAAIGA